MKKICLILLPMLLVACAAPKDERAMLTGWMLDYGGTDYPATVPGFVHTDLMANGIIPDPYLATNEDSVRWVGECKWTYTLKLDRSRLPQGDSLWIVFEGVAGHADVVQIGQGDVPETGQSGAQACALAVLRQIGDAGADGIRRRMYL